MPAAEYHTPRILTKTTAATNAKSLLISACFFVSVAFAAKPGLVDGTRIPGKWGKGSVSCLQLPE